MTLIYSKKPSGENSNNIFETTTDSKQSSMVAEVQKFVKIGVLDCVTNFAPKIITNKMD